VILKSIPNLDFAEYSIDILSTLRPVTRREGQPIVELYTAQAVAPIVRFRQILEVFGNFSSKMCEKGLQIAAIQRKF